MSPRIHDGPAHLYRCYDGDGRLIYVGATSFLGRRLDQHRRSTWWAPQVVRVRAKLYPSFAAARQAERIAIIREAPRWNIVARWSRRQNWSAADYEDYVRARRGLRVTYSSFDSLRATQAECERRFGHVLDIGPRPHSVDEAVS